MTLTPYCHTSRSQCQLNIWKQIVTLKHTNIILAAFWVSSSIAALCYISDYRITFWFGYICIPSCLLISMVSYTKIFGTLIHHQAQVQVQVHLQSSHPCSLNISRYRKAVYKALWVQLAFVVCYVPFTIVEIVFAKASKITFSSHLLVISSSNFSLLQLDVKSVSLLLED